MKVPDHEPPEISEVHGGLRVLVHDQLTGGETLELRPDLVVLVTGMEASSNAALVDVLKLPVGQDGFLNEIHPKLRPVETVLDGVLIAGAAQGPKNLPESVASAMASVAKAGALLLKGYIDLAPFVATVDPLACTGCWACLPACPYGAIGELDEGGRRVAAVNQTLCKGCGGCVPSCPEEALAVEGYTHQQVKAMIDALAKEVA